MESIYFHPIKIQVESSWNISVMAGFTRKLSFPAILGRNGFFDNFTVLFNHSTKPPEMEIERIKFLQ